MSATRLSVFFSLLLAASFAKGQDAHFAQVQGMNIWCNPALKTNMVPLAHINIRSVNYPGVIAYTSKAATVELPLIGRDKDETDVIPFIHLAAGINVDNSSNRFMNVSTGMLSFSYALPLNEDYTYLSAGFQVAYTFSRIGLGGNFHFPGQFDKYGELGPAIAADPYQSGYNYGYFTAGVGASIFHNGIKRQWYAGGSLRHLNKPYTEWNHSVRLAGNYGIQAGFMTAVTDDDAIGAYANLGWQGSTHEQLIGLRYTRLLEDSAKYSISPGIGYRSGDALIPNLELKAGEHRLAFFYEISIFSAAPAGYRRNVFEFSYALGF